MGGTEGADKLALSKEVNGLADGVSPGQQTNYYIVVDHCRLTGTIGLDSDRFAAGVRLNSSTKTSSWVGR